MDSFVLILELIGTIGFAVSGAVLAIKKDFDLFGIIILGNVAAVGGGCIRDIILGAAPPVMFTNPFFCLTATVVSLLVCLPFTRKLLNNKKVNIFAVVFMDSIGLSIFTVNGIIYSSEYFPENPFLLFFTGVVTGVGGGVLRDVLCCERPYIFTKHIYASAACAGAVVCILLMDYIPQIFAMCIGAGVILIIRLISAYFHLNLPHIREKNN